MTAKVGRVIDAVWRMESARIIGALARMLRDVGWRGIFMIELLRGTDGTPWFMELNGRPWGSMALARRAGLEYPAWAVARRLDPAYRPPALPPAAPRTARHLGRELVHQLRLAP